MMNPAETLLFLTAGALSSSRLRFGGVSRYAARRGWAVQAVEYVGAKTALDELFRFWHPIGAVLEYGEDLPRNAVRHFRSVPVVCLDRDPSWGGVCVCQDSCAAGAMVARELLRSGDRRSFGYVGFPVAKFWDDERRDGFVSTLELNGRGCSVFDSSECNDKNLFQRMSRWLRELPLPCGIMASNDAMAMKLIGVCARLGLSIPDEVSVAGVDNAIHFCESVSPTLTSVEADFEGSGYLAAETIDRLLRGETLRERVLRFSPLRLVRRASTTVLRRADGAVSRAIDFIRLRAPTPAGLRAMDVVALMGCSRRSAEMRFRAAVGHGIFEEINFARLEQAKVSLCNHALTIENIAGRCGFGTVANFHRAFRLAEGVSPGEWRADCRMTRMAGLRKT